MALFKGEVSDWTWEWAIIGAIALAVIFIIVGAVVVSRRDIKRQELIQNTDIYGNPQFGSDANASLYPSY